MKILKLYLRAGWGHESEHPTPPPPLPDPTRTSHWWVVGSYGCEDVFPLYSYSSQIFRSLSSLGNSKNLLSSLYLSPNENCTQMLHKEQCFNFIYQKKKKR